MSSVVLLYACGQTQHGAGSAIVPQAFQRMEPASTPNGDSLRDGQAHTLVQRLGDVSPNASLVGAGNIGSDGRLYFTTIPRNFASPTPESGEIGNFDFTTRTQKYQTVPYLPGYIQETANGSVWVGEWNNASGSPTFDRYSGIGGTDTKIAIPIGPLNPGGLNGLDGGIAVGGDGELWFGVGNIDNGGNDVGEIDQRSNAVTLYPLPTPLFGDVPSTGGLVLGPDTYIWAIDPYGNYVFRIASKGSQRGMSTYVQLPQGSFQPPYYPIADGIGIAGNGVYVSVYLSGISTGAGALDESAVGANPSFQALNLPSTGIEPFLPEWKAGKLYFLEWKYGGLGVYDPGSGKMVILPTAVPAAGDVIAVDRDGHAWVSCVTAGLACIERIDLTSTWAVFPGLSLKLYTSDSNGNQLPPGLLGIGETGNSGPFTVKSSNATVCQADVVSGFDHDVQVLPAGSGKCVVTIADAHAHSVNVNVTVLKGSGNPRSSPYHSFRLR